MSVSINKEGTLKEVTGSTYVNKFADFFKSTLGTVNKYRCFNISGSSFTGSYETSSRTTLPSSLDATKIIYSVLTADLESVSRSTYYYTYATPFVFLLHNDNSTTGHLYRYFTFYTRDHAGSKGEDPGTNLSQGMYPIYQVMLVKLSSLQYLDISVMNRTTDQKDSDIFTIYGIYNVQWHVFYSV